MPYKVFKDGEKFCIYKHDDAGNKTGDTLGCHPSQEEADKQLAALYANEPAAGKSINLDQRRYAIDDAWRVMFPPPKPIEMPMVYEATNNDPFIVEYGDDYVIVYQKDKYYRVGYIAKGEKVELAQQSDWTEVQSKTDWVNVAKSIKSGARHSISDQQHINAAIDNLVQAGGDHPMMHQPPGDVYAFPLLKSTSNSLKAISKTDEEMRVANYLVLFGGRDLTGVIVGKNQDGSMGEYFTPETNFESSYTKTGVLHVDFEHGTDPDEIGATSDEVLGYVDWKSAKKDSIGLYAERVLYRRQQYMEFLEALIEAGLVGNSTESIPGKAIRNENGEITRWPLKRDSLTVQPMEPRMLTDNALSALKALTTTFPNLKSLINQPGGTSEPKENTMPEITEEKVQGWVTAAVSATATDAADKAVKAFVATLPDNGKGGHNVTVVIDEADKPFQKLGDQLAAVKQATLTQGRELAPRLKALNLKALGANELVGSEGGFLLEPSFAAGMLTPVHDQGAFSSRAAKMPIGPNANGVTVRGIDETNRATGSRWGGIQGYRLAEAGTFTASQPTMRLIELRLKKYAVLCYATDELLQDTTALASVVQQGCSEELDFMVNDDILNGLGVGGPLGILNAGALVTVNKASGQAAKTLMTENIVAMWARMSPRSKANSVWFINNDVTPQLYTMSLAVGTGGMPMFMMPGSLPNSPAGTLFGRPVVETEFNATLGTAGDILLADMSQYVMIDRDVTAASSIHLQFLTDQVAFRFVYRCDGQPKISTPLVPYKGTGNTLSPFVALQTRS